MHNLLIAVWSTALCWMAFPIYASFDDASLLWDYWEIYTGFTVLTAITAWSAYRQRLARPIVGGQRERQGP